MRLAIIDVKPGMELAGDVCKNGRVLLKSGTVLTPVTIEILKKRGIIAVEVRAAGEQAGPPPRNQDLAIISLEIRQEAEQIIRTVWEEVRRGGRVPVNRVKGMVETILQELWRKKVTFLKLVDIRVLDNYTFSHSVNVCVLSLSLGLAQGYTEEELLDLGLGALLHDLGKMIIPVKILNKPGPLSPGELAIIRKHPAHGFRLLSREPEISRRAALIAYQHHERHLGGGYPQGLKDGEIHDFAQLVAVADIYDALTSDRVYRSRLKPYEAVEILMAMSGRDLNPKMVSLFLESIAIYPVGCLVELNNGSLGMVTAVNRQLPIRPRVTRLVRQGGNYLPTGEELDLMQHPTVFITRVVGLHRLTTGSK